MMKYETCLCTPGIRDLEEAIAALAADALSEH